MLTSLVRMLGLESDRPSIGVLVIDETNFSFIRQQILHQALDSAKNPDGRETDKVIRILLETRALQDISDSLFVKRPNQDPFNASTTTRERYRVVIAHAMLAFLTQVTNPSAAKALIVADAQSTVKGMGGFFVSFIAQNPEIYSYSIQFSVLVSVLVCVILMSNPNERYKEAYRWLHELNLDEEVHMHIHGPVFERLSRFQYTLH